MGTPFEVYNEGGNRIWERQLDIYGGTKKEYGETNFIPYLYQGQYLDVETGLAYNRFRYYSTESGTYISQDPIGLDGGMPNMYAYVGDLNSQFDPFGLKIWSYSNMPKIDGMELHHVIPKSLKNHDLLKSIGYDVNKVNSLIYLPKEFGDYGSRSAHKGWSGDHSKYNKMMKQELDDLAEAAKANNWSKQKINDAVEDLRKSTRQGLRNGKIKCR